MRQNLPERCIIEADPVLARACVRAAERLEAVEPADLYQQATQEGIRDAIRAAAPQKFDALLQQINERLGSDLPLAVVRGMKWDERAMVCIALNSGLGRLVAGRYAPPRTQIPHRIQIRSEIPIPTGERPLAEDYHSDGVTEREPPELLTLVCVRPDEDGGGRTLLITRDQVLEALSREEDGGLVSWLSETRFPWRISDPRGVTRSRQNLDRLQEELGTARVDSAGAGIVHRPVLFDDRILWRLDTILHGFLLLGEEASEPNRDRLKRMRDCLRNTDLGYEFQVEAGEFLAADNLRTLHGRTPLSRSPQASRRLHLRCWVRRRSGLAARRAEETRTKH